MEFFNSSTPKQFSFPCETAKNLFNIIVTNDFKRQKKSLFEIDFELNVKAYYIIQFKL